MLVGRRAEADLLDRLLAEAREGRSGALVVRGEAGVGKSALLRHAVEHADGFTVLRCVGIESESELAFAGLHQLLRPLLPLLDRLPEPHAAAVRAAFALSTETVRDRFRIALAALGLLSEEAERRPVVCVVDDAQWLDLSSLDALLFVARRIHAEGIVLLFGVRGDGAPELSALGVTELELRALDADAARELISNVHGFVSPAVCDRLVSDAAGNALALVELPAALSYAQLSGAEMLPATLPLTRDLERVFLDRVRQLPEATQEILLIVAADDGGSLAPVMRAAKALGIGADALEDAEAAGLVAIERDTVEVRHPLVRSAVYQGATSSRRRAAHLALAAAMPHELDADRRAWHRAAAALEPDEEIAAALAASGERARSRGAHAGAAAAFERCAALTRDRRLRARRVVEAARSAWSAGQPDRARAFLSRVEPDVPDRLVRVDAKHVAAEIELRSGGLLGAAAVLLEGAAEVEELDTGKALAMLFDATEAAAWAGDHARMSEVTRRAALVPGANDDAHAFLANLLVATGGLMEGRPPSELPSIDDLILRSERFDEPRWLVWAAVAAGAVGNADGEAALLRRAASLARTSGAIDTLVLVVQVKAGLALLEGRFDVQAEVTEGLRLAREANLTNVVALHLAVLAWFAAASGEAERGPGYAAEASELARTNGAGFANAIAEWALAHRDLTEGRAGDVASRLSDLRTAPTGLMHPQIVLLSTPDLVEALVRGGHADEAHAANELLAASAVPGVAAWLRALAARTRALLAEDDVDAESSFEEALELHGEWPRPFDRARTELLFGEHLRRRRRRSDARTHLRSALQTLEALGAEPWAERARVELRASGETAHRRDPAALTELTPQELQIARLVAEGASNKEVAVQLFLSPRTVEYHLRKVFLKLGITSRSQLHRQALGAAA